VPETGRTNQMDVNKQSVLDLLDQTIGIPIEIISSDFEEFAGNTHHKIVFQIQLDDPDIFAIGVLFVKCIDPRSGCPTGALGSHGTIGRQVPGLSYRSLIESIATQHFLPKILF
jgi:hypothetical protein